MATGIAFKKKKKKKKKGKKKALKEGGGKKKTEIGKEKRKSSRLITRCQNCQEQEGDSNQG